MQDVVLHNHNHRHKGIAMENNILVKKLLVFQQLFFGIVFLVLTLQLQLGNNGVNRFIVEQ